MTKFGSGYVSALCRRCVGPLAVVLFAAGAAHAEPWEAFQTRCLMPMENVSSVDTSELLFAGKRDGPTTLSVYLPPSQGYLFMVVRDEDHTSLGCSVNLGENASQETQDKFAAQFLAWSKSVVGDEKYILTDDNLHSPESSMALHSNLTREPILSVSLWKQEGNNTWVASVQETDLES